MKSFIAVAGLGTLVLVTDLTMLQAVAGGGPSLPLLEWWGPLIAVVSGLTVIVTLRASFAAHKVYVEAQLAQAVTRAEFALALKSVEDLHKDVREIRDLVTRWHTE